MKEQAVFVKQQCPGNGRFSKTLTWTYDLDFGTNERVLT